MSRPALMAIPLLVIAGALAIVGCAAHRPAPVPPASEHATSPAPETGLGWRTLDPSGPPTTDDQLRVQLEDRRHELLERCDEVLTALQDQRRQMGSIGSQIALGMAAGALAGVANQQVQNATGQLQQQPIPVNVGGNVGQTVRIDTRIRTLRDRMHTLVIARTNGEILDALDRLAPECTSRR